jgi:hypothetical protein
MDAPETIYLFPDDRFPSNRGLSICWAEAPYVTGSIEYVRADAFIERVMDFLNNDLCCYIKAQEFTIDFPRLEKDFEKAMREKEV